MRGSDICVSFTAQMKRRLSFEEALDKTKKKLKEVHVSSIHIC